MTIKVWSYQVLKDEDFTEAKVSDSALLEGIKLNIGKSLKADWPVLILDVVSEYPPADAFMSGSMLVVSRQLAEIIFKYASSNDAEFLPVDVRFKGRKYSEYGVLNILVMLDVLDRQRSDFTEMDGLVDAIEKLAIDESNIDSKSIFLIDAIEWVICVSDELASEIEKSGFRGVIFKEPDEWSPW